VRSSNPFGIEEEGFQNHFDDVVVTLATSSFNCARVVNLNAQRIPDSFAPWTFTSLSSMNATSDGSASIFYKALRKATGAGLQLPNSHEVRMPSKRSSHPAFLKYLAWGNEVFEKRYTR
jgi:hypothetical protein